MRAGDHLTEDVVGFSEEPLRPFIQQSSNAKTHKLHAWK